MTGRRNFDEDYVRSQLDNLSAILTRRLTIYVAGGAALALTGLKEATKDIDVVVRNTVEVNSLLTGLRKLGYRDPRQFLTTGVGRMHARALRENSDGFRWDIFEKAVAGRLSLSKGMIGRAVEYGITGNRLRVRLLSREDVFLFKSVTDREGDLDDMRVIAESSVNWAVIARECRGQSNRSGAIWENALCERLQTLRTRYSIVSPIEKAVCGSAARKILKLAKKRGKYRGLVKVGMEELERDEEAFVATGRR